MLSITVDRSSLSKSDLVITDYPTGGLWLPEDGLGRPGKSWRRTYATSPWVHGSVQTQATLDQSSQPLSIYAQGTTTAALRTLQAEVEEAFFQFVFPLTITEDGESQVWECDSADISWGDLDSGLTAAHLARATVTIPVYPVAS